MKSFVNYEWEVFSIIESSNLANSSVCKLFFLATVLSLSLVVGCFQDPTGPLLTKDIQRLEKNNLLHASIQPIGIGGSVDLDEIYATSFLQSLTPINSAKEQHSPLLGVDYEFIFQSGRNPLWVSVDVSGTDDRLIYQIDNYVYTGGSIKGFLHAVEKAGIDIQINN